MSFWRLDFRFRHVFPIQEWRNWKQAARAGSHIRSSSEELTELLDSRIAYRAVLAIMSDDEADPELLELLRQSLGLAAHTQGQISSDTGMWACGTAGA